MVEKIPKLVKNAFESLYSGYEGTVKLLGIHDGVKWYYYDFKEICEIGFPYLFAEKNGKLLERSEREAFNLINLFSKN